ncbi:toprim domain-containing protein [Priestia megaterium]
MSWFDDVSKYIRTHFDDYISHFYGAGAKKKRDGYYLINPCPFCQREEKFYVTRDKNAAHCFHSECNESGSLITIVQKMNGEEEGLQMLADWSGISKTDLVIDPEKAAAKEKQKRIQTLYHEAVDIYHLLLRKYEVKAMDSEGVEKSPLDYQLQARGHTMEGLEKNKVGYSPGYQALAKMLAKKGYSEQEIKDAYKVIGVPANYFVYPYYDEQGNVVRLNCRAFLRKCHGEKKEDGTYDICGYSTFDTKIKSDDHPHIQQHPTHRLRDANYSTGEKVLLVSLDEIKQKPKKALILVEGENDKISMEEGLAQIADYSSRFTVGALGGNFGKGAFSSKYLRKFETVYEAFDNDVAGDKYREQLDEEMPDVPLKRIEYPQNFNDPDDFVRFAENPIDSLKEVIDNAKMVPTNNALVHRHFPKHDWTVKNRNYQINYSITGFNKRNHKFEGSVEVVKNGQITDKRNGDIQTIRLENVIQNYKFQLSDAIHKYYHDLGYKDLDGKPARKFNHLLDMYRFAKEENEVAKQIAWYLHKARQTNAVEYDKLTRIVEKAIKNQDRIDLIFKEVTAIDNYDAEDIGNYPRIQVSQALFPNSGENGDGYMYYVKHIKDTDAPKYVPCLLNNKKEEIRLDLFKKPDPQSILLVDNKYQLPGEIPVNLREDVENLSLQYRWVKKWQNGEITPDEIDPVSIIQEIEAFIRQVYYASDEVTKVLALWIYSTYFYTLFGDGFPYLLLNGGKGTGKSTIDAIINLVAFNPLFTVNTSGSAMFRHLHNFGGTYILDEAEYLSDAKKMMDSDIGAVLKGGYSSQGIVSRTNQNTNLPEYFNIFGPKVISNISGVEPIIADRCLIIETFGATEEKVRELVPPTAFLNEGRTELYSLTSRAAISALVHFKSVHEIKKTDTRLDTGNLRLTQILQPLVTIAKLVGDDYLNHLIRFYQTDIARQKNEITLDTLEGKIHHIFVSLSKEILGISEAPWVLENNNGNEFDDPIEVYEETFTVNSMHLVLLAEQLSNTNDTYNFREINNAVKATIGKDATSREVRQEKRITVSNDDVLKRHELKSKKLRGYKWTFNARRFITKEEEQKIKEEMQQESPF